MNSSITQSGIFQASIADITVERQVRSTLDPRQVALLAASMEAIGQQTPITLRRGGDRWIVVDGHYRLAVAKALGWKTIAANVVELPPDSNDMLAEQLATLCRTDANCVERANAYDQLFRKGLTGARIAAIAGVSESQVSRTRALVTLRPELRDLVAGGKLGPSVALELNHVSDPVRYADLIALARQCNLTRDHLLTPPRKARVTTNRPTCARVTIPLEGGCAFTVACKLDSITQVVNVLRRFIERAKDASIQAQGDLSQFLTLLRRIPTA